MQQSTRHMRTTASVFVAVFVLAANRTPAAVAGTISCNIPQPCALYQNAQGSGVQGTSARIAGVVGTTTFGTTSASAAAAGVSGIDASTNHNVYNEGVLGFSPFGLGAVGKSTYGTGVFGSSAAANGIVGQTSATAAVRHAGVTGTDLSTNTGKNVGVLGTVGNGAYGVEGVSGNGAKGGVLGVGTSADGVIGQSGSGTGVYGSSTSYVGVEGDGQYGVFGNTSSGTGVEGQTGNGYGVSGYASAGGTAGAFFTFSGGTGVIANSDTGYAVKAITGGSVAVYAKNSNGNAVDATGSYIGLVGRSSSYPLVLTDPTGATNLVYVDGAGNFYAHSYNTFLVTPRGVTLSAHTTSTTTSNVEDVGSGELVAGSAVVRLDAAFAASLDGAEPYHVFITPGGDSHGLYVAEKTPTGFVVRESLGGRSNLTFDYRVVGRAAGQGRDRMAIVTPQTLHMPSAKIVTGANTVPKLLLPELRPGSSALHR